MRLLSFENWRPKPKNEWSSSQKLRYQSTLWASITWDKSRHRTRKTLGKFQYLQNICELKRFMINTHQLLSGICSCLLISFLCKLFLETGQRELLWDSYRAQLGGRMNLERKRSDCKTLDSGFEQSSFIALSSPKPITTKSLVPLTKQEISILCELIKKNPDMTLALMCHQSMRDENSCPPAMRGRTCGSTEVSVGGVTFCARCSGRAGAPRSAEQQFTAFFTAPRPPFMHWSSKGQTEVSSGSLGFVHLWPQSRRLQSRRLGLYNTSISNQRPFASKITCWQWHC